MNSCNLKNVLIGRKNSSRFIVHCDVDSFYVACERLQRPELCGVPVVVTQQNAGGFVAVSSEARVCGIRKGDGIGEAGQKNIEFFKNRPDALMSSVRKRCPSLIILPMRTDYYRAVSKDIRTRLIDCNVGVVEQTSIDALILGEGIRKRFAISSLAFRRN